MIHNIPEPDLSPDFTIEDIHKVREWNYECQRNMTPAERVADTARRGKEALVRFGLMDINAGAREGLKQIEELRASKRAGIMQ